MNWGWFLAKTGSPLGTIVSVEVEALRCNWIGDDFTLFTQRCFKLPGKSRMAESILISCTQCVALGGSLSPQCKYLARAEGPVSAEVGDPHR